MEMSTETQVPLTPHAKKQRLDAGKYPPIALEICCGHAGLSIALQERGWQVKPIDWLGNEHKPGIPILHKDLTDQKQVYQVIRMLERASYVHMAPPCGTASRARERWVKTKDGRPCPRPLRSARYPLGLPFLREYEQAKVDSANKIYEAMSLFMKGCHKRNIPFTIENPKNSYFWYIPVIEHTMNEIQTIEVDLQACMYGAQGLNGLG